MRTTQHEALVRRAVAAIWNRGELDVADVLFAATYINHDGLIPDVVRGPEAIKVSVALYRLAFPDLQITVEDLTEDGDTLRLRWTAHSVTAADRGCGASSSTAGRLIGTLTSRMAGGQIAESWVQWDREAALTSLGLLPSVG